MTFAAVADVIRHFIHPVQPMVVHFFAQESKDRMSEIARKNIQLRNMAIDLDKEMVRRHESEYRLRALAEASLCAILVQRDHQVLIANELFEKLLGYSEKCLKENSEIMWHAFVSPPIEEVQKRIDSINMEPYRGAIRSADGTVHDVYIRPKNVEYNGHGICRAVRITPWEERYAE